MITLYVAIDPCIDIYNKNIFMGHVRLTMPSEIHVIKLMPW
jgi:hypothetical protein